MNRRAIRTPLLLHESIDKGIPAFEAALKADSKR